MIQISLDKNIYKCPFCGQYQVFDENYCYFGPYSHCSGTVNKEQLMDDFFSLTLYCHNPSCEKVSTLLINRGTGKQIDIIPDNSCIQFPDYIPEIIRKDYEEGASIIEKSPKAAATLFRRCLQGMIRDFWHIKKGNLYEEINELQGKVTESQWKAIDGLRKIGNIGAHMEKDINTIIDIEPEEAAKLQKLIEQLLDKWYINKHEEEELYSDIVNVADEKFLEKKIKLEPLVK